MKLYIDKWGDKWKRLCNGLVIRLSDGNVGGWYNGQGLTEIPNPVDTL